MVRKCSKYRADLKALPDDYAGKEAGQAFRPDRRADLFT